MKFYTAEETGQELPQNGLNNLKRNNMEAKEIQERNKQIALMLSLKPLTSPYLGAYQPTRDTHNPKFYHERMEGESWYVYPNYDSDWNWLMEAVEFIEKQKMEVVEFIEKQKMEVSIIQNECSIIDTEKAEQEENPFMIEPVAKCYDGETKKEAVFIAVSDFAKLYNNKEI
jgi:hypothetical protein